jgi:GcrA cell cycle regulator
MNFAWTPDVVARLERFHGEGLSAAQIAAALGGDVTRNAVIGKMARLGLTASNRPGRTAPVTKPAQPAAAKVDPALVVEATPAPVTNVEAPSTKPEPLDLSVTIDDLRDSNCRWPLWSARETSGRYCGCRAVLGESYCATHLAIGTVPFVARRKVA